mgnify:CR=1 FL=1
MIAFWPEPADLARFIDEPAERTFELARALVSDVRSTRARYRISPSRSCAARSRPALPRLPKTLSAWPTSSADWPM